MTFSLLSPQVLAQQGGDPMVSWLLLTMVGGAVLAGVVLTVVLLGNRHTRGTATAVLLLGALGVAAFGFWSASRSRDYAAVIEPPSGEQQAMATHLLSMAETLEHEGHGGGDRLARAYRQQAAQILEPHVLSGTSTSYKRSFGFALVSPLFLIPVVVIFYLLFKHCGRGVGIAALAVPLGILFLGFIGVTREQAYHTSQAMGGINTYPQGITDEYYPAHEIMVSGPWAEVAVESTAEVEPPPAAEAPLPPEPVAIVSGDSTSQESTNGEVSANGEASANGERSGIDTEQPEPTAEQPSGDGEQPTPDGEEPQGEEAEGEPASEIGSEDPVASPPATLPADMPEWVTNPPKSVENVYRRVVQSDWQATKSVCMLKVQQQADQAVLDYLRELIIEETRKPPYFLPSLEAMGISPRFVREQIVADEYYQTRDFSHADGMENLYQLLEFERADTEHLLERWRNYERRGRVTAVGTLLGGVLATLAGLLGLIKLDTYTKGYYTKRLFIGVPAAIIGTVVLLAVLTA